MTGRPARRLCLEGRLTLRDVASLQSRLLEAFAHEQAIVLEADRLEAVDAAILQLLISAARTARERSLGFGFEAAPVGAMAEALAAMGLIAQPGEMPQTWLAMDKYQ